jgi:diguanylate cyclase (GGDEF)-like protein
MLDLDHFKRYNDTFGHDAGDALLRTLGRFLIEHVRGGDIACRYGGEEFALILPEAPLNVVRERLEALRTGIRQLDVKHQGQMLGAISVSCGVSCFPEHGSTAQAMLRAADQALYRAKQAGRDRVEVAEPPGTGSG